MATVEEMKDILRPFIHCLYLFYARKNLHQNNTRQWESILTKSHRNNKCYGKVLFHLVQLQRQQ